MRTRSVGFSNRSTWGISIVIPVSARAVLITSCAALSDSRGIATPASLAVPMSKVASACGSLPVRWIASQRRLDSSRAPPASLRSSSTVAWACRAASSMTSVTAVAFPPPIATAGPSLAAAVAIGVADGFLVAVAEPRPPPRVSPATGA